MKRFFSILSFCSLFCLSSCLFFSDSIDPARITSINILDRNGLSQTISSKNRLSEYEQTDFLSPQPYQKVMRVYGKEKNGDVRAQITSYHPNGQIKQYLEALNNRAYGSYFEWFPNGQIKIQATVIGGVADLNSQAEESWLFDQATWAWDDEGRFLAEILYARGELEGESRYYHTNGNLWKCSPYHKGKLHGVQQIYKEDKSLLQSTTYDQGLKEGIAYRYWSEDQLASEELYLEGNLIDGLYFSQEGTLISEIHGGNGHRAVFGKTTFVELQEYRGGKQEGVVEIFNERQNLLCRYSLLQGEKQGEEISYYSNTNTPKLQLTWNQGQLQGPIKTWYEDGTLESQREMSQNQKNGLLTAWYKNGHLMLVEEYENDLLIKGEYYRLGDSIPSSKIECGKGVATLFNAEGNLLKKVYYQEGRPVE